VTTDEQVKAPLIRTFSRHPNYGDRKDYGLTELNASESVDKGYMSHNDWMAHCARYAYVRKCLLNARTKGPIDLLDMGCGRLALPHYLWRNRTPPIDSYWGVDLRATEGWPDAIGWRTPIHLLRADLIDPALPVYIREQGGPKQFTFVVCFEALEHMPRAAGFALLTRLFFFTKPGGTCLLSSPNAGVSDSTAANHLDRSGHSMEWTFDEKVLGVHDAGFDVLEAFGTFCGTTRLPAGWDEGSDEGSRIVRQAKRFLDHTWFTVFAAAAFPRYSNNALLVLRKPPDAP
jgi:hypothetical protein